jgi:hypothetical protein
MSTVCKNGKCSFTSSKKKVMTKTLKENVGYISVIDQIHRFTLAGRYREIGFLIKCSIVVTDYSKFNSNVITTIYENTLKNVIKFFKYKYPIELRVVTKEDNLTLKRDLNKELSDNVEDIIQNLYGSIKINNINIWDDKEYFSTHLF